MKPHSLEDTDSYVKGRGCTRLRNRNEAKGSWVFTSFMEVTQAKSTENCIRGVVSFPFTQTEELIEVQTPEVEQKAGS